MRTYEGQLIRANFPSGSVPQMFVVPVQAGLIELTVIFFQNIVSEILENKPCYSSGT